MTDSPPHRVVIVGGGAAGLQLATQAGDRLRPRAHVTLVERARTHLWKPLLHAVAAGSMDPAKHELNYLSHAHAHHFDYCLGEMTGLDRAAHLVHIGASLDDEGREIIPARTLAYDTLVIAVGSVTNDFGTPGAPPTPYRSKRPSRLRALTGASSMRAFVPTRRTVRSGRVNSTWRSSVPVPPERSLPPSCTTRSARWSAKALITSTQCATCASS